MERSHARILESVSRSFNLSIRFLPRAMQEPVALGYLLARFTDTIADTPSLDPVQRGDYLAEIEDSLDEEGKSEVGSLETIASQIDHPGEKALVLQSNELFLWLHTLDPANRKLIIEVLKTILRGQRWDAESAEKKGIAGCDTADELLRYTYEVAGCVGEFWTWVGYVNLGDRFADPAAQPQMLEAGRKLGQALQLTNILRDLHEDVPNRRLYLPHDAVRAAGWDGGSEIRAEHLEPVFEKWIGICEGFLEEAHSYVVRVRDPRVRFSTRLPKLLAESTVAKLRDAGVERILSERVRISRNDVWKKVGEAVFF